MKLYRGRAHDVAQEMESQTGYQISRSLVPLQFLYNILRKTPVYVTSDIQLQRYCEFFLLLFAGWPGSTLSPG